MIGLNRFMPGPALASSLQIRTMYPKPRGGSRPSSLLWCSHKKKKCVSSPCTLAVNSRSAAVAFLWASVKLPGST
jgi:hypothetical protein